MEALGFKIFLTERVKEDEESLRDGILFLFFPFVVRWVITKPFRASQVYRLWTPRWAVHRSGIATGNNRRQIKCKAEALIGDWNARNIFVYFRFERRKRVKAHNTIESETWVKPRSTAFNENFWKMILKQLTGVWSMARFNEISQNPRLNFQMRPNKPERLFSILANCAGCSWRTENKNEMKLENCFTELCCELQRQQLLELWADSWHSSHVTRFKTSDLLRGWFGISNLSMKIFPGDASDMLLPYQKIAFEWNAERVHPRAESAHLRR